MYQYVSYIYLQNITWRDMTLHMNVAGCSNQPSHFNASKAIRNTSVEVPTWHSGAWSMSCCISDHNQKENMCYLYLDDFRKKTQNHESLGHELTWLHLRFYPKGRSDAWQVAPQRFRYKVMNPQLWNQQNRLGSPWGFAWIDSKVSLFSPFERFAVESS